MNRNDEYRRLLLDLDEPNPAAAGTLKRAKARNSRRIWLVRPIAGCSAIFACFVLLVNFCAPVALACSQVPVLKELAAAVTFSRSLTDAVQNSYVQPMKLSQTAGGITAEVKYLIVDRKQVNVFYTLFSDTYQTLADDPDFRAADGSGLSAIISYGSNGAVTETGKLRCSTIDFVDDGVPGSLRLILNVRSASPLSATASTEAAAPATDALLIPPDTAAPDYLAHFDFLLEFDPTFTETGKTVEINRAVTLDGQQLMLTDMEIYPTHLRLNVADVPGNTAWLERLDFYIETDKGKKFDVISNGILATGSADSPMMVSYRADSTYFYKAEHLKIVITGAQWLDKDMETVRLNLASGKADRMPDGTEICGVERSGDGWLIVIRAKERRRGAFHQVFLSSCLRPDGSEACIQMWYSTSSYKEYPEMAGYFYEILPLPNYPYDEVLLKPAYSRLWSAPEPISVTVR